MNNRLRDQISQQSATEFFCSFSGQSSKPSQRRRRRVRERTHVRRSARLSVHVGAQQPPLMAQPTLQPAARTKPRERDDESRK